MYKTAIILFLIGTLGFTACTKGDLVPVNLDPDQFMRTHQSAEVVLSDYFSGNYIVQTRQGFAVVEGWGGIVPRDFDLLFGHFQFTGLQDIYNYRGNYFIRGRIVDTWLTWGEALYLLDQISR